MSNRKHEPAEHAKLLTVCGIILASILAASNAMYQQLQSPLDAAQQTVITSSTRVVVVLIPGFPIESIVFGILVGLLALQLIRKRRVSTLRR